MGRKNKSSKAAEKKRDRLELEKRMNSRVSIVKKANEQEDPMATLAPFKVSVREIYTSYGLMALHGLMGPVE